MTATEMGEYVVGAWLREVAGCDFVDYNVRPPVGGSEGQSEFDVVGFHFGDRVAYLCKVATHLDGINYGSYAETLDRVTKKHGRQREYAGRYLGDFARRHFMLWSPRVPVGKLMRGLDEIDGLELVVNETYAERVEELRERARRTTRETGNPFYRVLQILEHLRL